MVSHVHRTLEIYRTNKGYEVPLRFKLLTNKEHDCVRVQEDISYKFKTRGFITIKLKQVNSDLTLDKRQTETFCRLILPWQWVYGIRVKELL